MVEGIANEILIWNDSAEIKANQLDHNNRRWISLEITEIPSESEAGKRLSMTMAKLTMQARLWPEVVRVVQAKLMELYKDGG